MSQDQNTFNNVEAFLKGMAYFSSPSLRVFIGGNERTVSTGVEIDVSYIQYTPQQMIVPIYNIFSHKPSMMLTGNSIVKGAIGFNFSLATYVQSFSDADLNSDMLYTGAMPVFSNVPKEKANGSVYLPSLRLEFINDVLLRHGPEDHDFKSVVPTISMFDVYISGGVITVAPDGSPVQDIYQFLARSSSRIDLTFSQESLKTMDEKLEEQEEKIPYNPPVLPKPVPFVPPT